MWLVHRGKHCIEIDEKVFRRLFTFYPEEKLLTRPLLADALIKSEITKTDLQKEASQHFIPWQMFLLSWGNLQKQLKRIEDNRKDKIQIGFFSTRSNGTGDEPNRLIDRYIRAQSFLASEGGFGPNIFNNSLKSKTVAGSVDLIVKHFAINRNTMWSKSQKQAAFDYLVERLESGQINVVQGTGDSRLVPRSPNHKALYKNISGFCLHDAKVPFLFVNLNMADEEEPVGRQLYTLVYLLVLIGLGIFTITRDWRPGQSTPPKHKEYFKLAHDIASEFLLPQSVVEDCRGKKINRELVSQLSDKYKITPTAVIYRLWLAKIITVKERDTLIPERFMKKSGGRTPRIDRSVKKLNGKIVVDTVNTAFKAERITQNQAQYVLFGRVRPKTWRDYRNKTSL